MVGIIVRCFLLEWMNSKLRIRCVCIIVMCFLLEWMTLMLRLICVHRFVTCYSLSCCVTRLGARIESIERCVATCMERVVATYAYIHICVCAYHVHICLHGARRRYICLHIVPSCMHACTWLKLAHVLLRPEEDLRREISKLSIQ